jgi:hypothetical protein
MQLFNSVLHQREPSIDDTQFFPDQGAHHDQKYADRKRGNHGSVSNGSDAAVATLTHPPDASPCDAS